MSFGNSVGANFVVCLLGILIENVYVIQVMGFSLPK